MSTLRSHISDALVQLRRCMLGAVVVVFVSLLIHVLAVGFVHFTDVRFIERSSGAEQAPRIVQSTGVAPGVDLDKDQFDPTKHKRPISSAQIQGSDSKPTHLVIGPWDDGLRITNDISGAVGIFASWAIVLLAVLGVQVSAGGGVRGVHHMVSTCLWALGIAIFATPWDEALPSSPIPGVLIHYASVIEASGLATQHVHVIEFYLSSFVLPATLMVGSLVCAWKFTKGVEAGMYVPEATPFDIAIDREISEIRAGNISGLGGRTAGALTNAMSKNTKPEPGPSVDDAFPDRNKPGATHSDERKWVSHNDRAASKPNTSESGFRRPL